jgi:hypothetical protein
MEQFGIGRLIQFFHRTLFISDVGMLKIDEKSPGSFSTLKIFQPLLIERMI